MPKVMVLIDADNVTAEVIEQALEHVIETHGAAHVRRAYCTAEAAVKQHKLFKKHSIRPMVNVSAGKNSTDIALAVDAIDLASGERPDVAVIVSSDSDYAPLVLRLREKGCRVEGIGQQGKTSDDTKPVYDSFVDLVHQKARAARTPAKKAAPRAAPKTAARSASRASPPPAPPPTFPDDVAAILIALPELEGGGWMALNRAAEPLRQARLLGKNAPSPKLFGKYPTLFELDSKTKPSKVRFVGDA
jgi:hypothetical protein